MINDCTSHSRVSINDANSHMCTIYLSEKVRAQTYTYLHDFAADFLTLHTSRQHYLLHMVNSVSKLDSKY